MQDIYDTNQLSTVIESIPRRILSARRDDLFTSNFVFFFPVRKPCTNLQIQSNVIGITVTRRTLNRRRDLNFHPPNAILHVAKRRVQVLLSGKNILMNLSSVKPKNK